jgi:hypothetical protein
VQNDSPIPPPFPNLCGIVPLIVNSPIKIMKCPLWFEMSCVGPPTPQDNLAENEIISKNENVTETL